ncbi:MAG: DMT family transporter [Candidatus Gracilibacteria bacterium]|nr:DMT family transporter [Candidatus Gracilibacteria bacterium]
MFFLLVVLSMVAYSVQGTLLAHHVRKQDSLSVAMYRNISLIVTMSPLLFLATRQELQMLPDFLPELLWSGFLGAVGLMFAFWALKFLPVGVNHAFRRALSVITMFVLGFLVFGEAISWYEAGLAGLIIATMIWLGLQKNNFAHIDHRAGTGALLVVFSALAAGGSFVLMGKMAREISPAVAGYFWEVSIGIFIVLIGLGREWIVRKPIVRISTREFGRIALVSWPTLVGTGAFAYAVSLGPIGIANAIGVGGILIGTLLAHFLYKEKLTSLQWILLLALAAEIAVFKLLGY